MKNEITNEQLLSLLVEKVQSRLEDKLSDTIADELETLFIDYNIADEDGELMYELFGRVHLGYQ